LKENFIAEKIIKGKTIIGFKQKRIPPKASPYRVARSREKKKFVHN
jgi:hypothetical protein